MDKRLALPISLIWEYFHTPGSSFRLAHSFRHGQLMRCHHWARQWVLGRNTSAMGVWTFVHIHVSSHRRTSYSDCKMGSLPPLTTLCSLSFPHTWGRPTSSLMTNIYWMLATCQACRKGLLCIIPLGPLDCPPAGRHHHPHFSNKETEAPRG